MSSPRPQLERPRLPALTLDASEILREHVTGTHLHTLYGCEHELWLDFTRPKGEKLRPPAAVQELLARGRAYEEQVVAELDVVEPSYEPGDWARGAAETRRLLSEGHEWIFQGVLHRPPYLGLADLLHRVDHPSELGEHAYEVVDIKSSRKAKLEQILQVSFYSLLLGELQGWTPEEGALWLGTGREERFAIDDFVWTLADELDGLVALFGGERQTRPYRTPRCDGCGWREVCLPEMEAKNDLSLLPSISRARIARLHHAGIRDLPSLATADLVRMTKEHVLPPASARSFARQARAHVESRSHRVADETPELPAATVLWSLENDPFRDDGLFLVRAARVEDGRLDALFRRTIREDAEEPAALEEFLAWFGDHPAELALHFGERSTRLLARALAKWRAQEGPPGEPLASSRDLRALWLGHLALPVPCATLYELGVHLGTRERIEGGPMPALWWENARRTEDTAARDAWIARVEAHDQAEIQSALALLDALRELKNEGSRDA